MNDTPVITKNDRKTDKPMRIQDRRLVSRLNRRSVSNLEYWSFKDDSARGYGHGIGQYPAMIVPKLIGAILEDVKAIYPHFRVIGDPFVGSGTTLVESILHGFEFWGIDINPYAILLCKVRSHQYKLTDLKVKTQMLFERISRDTSELIEVDFNGIDKWFRRDVQVDLSRIRRSIMIEPDLDIRRLMWVALADTVKFTSNSRTSTYKLHIRDKETINERQIDPIRKFRDAVERYVTQKQEQLESLYLKSDLACDGQYKHGIHLKLGDSREVLKEIESKCDLIITSPPYGDNNTTVPYGQFSYLPLQWIELNDIVTGLDRHLLDTTCEIDRQSLGGIKKINNEEVSKLCHKSTTLSRHLDLLNSDDSVPEDSVKRIVSFVRDLNNSILPVLNMLKPGGLSIWILGNRKVGKKIVPLDRILIDLLYNCGNYLLYECDRSIHLKRHHFSDSLNREKVLIFRKEVENG